MESNRKFTLIVFNTCTQEYEEVIVTEEVYAREIGVSQPAVHKRKVRILKSLKKLLEN